MKLVLIPFEDAVVGERYLTKMKHGWIEGYWDGEDKTCHGYYWHDMEWFPYELYRIEKENGDNDND